MVVVVVHCDCMTVFCILFISSKFCCALKFLQLFYCSLLQIIYAHPNWPVYADVFEHPPPRLASRRPILHSVPLHRT